VKLLGKISKARFSRAFLTENYNRLFMLQFYPNKVVLIFPLVHNNP
jgi:hypothetical protein